MEVLNVQKNRSKNKPKIRIIDKTKNFLRRYGISVGILGCALIAAIVFFSGGNSGSESLEKEIPNDVFPPKKPVSTLILEQLPQVEVIQTEDTMPDIEEPEIEVLGVKKTESVVPDLYMPVDGKIVMEFARDKLIYSPTLLEYGTHLGLDIAGEMGQAVTACADGVISDTGNDKLMGNYVIIKHTDRLESAYYGLETISVEKGDKVSLNDVIGALGNSALIEVETGPHLHFEVLLDNVSVDPVQFFIE